MKLLIVGGGGYEVSVIDLLWFGNHLPKEVQVIQTDVLSLEESDLRGYEQIVFLAGLSNDPMAEFSPSRNFVHNAAAPAYLGYIAKRAGVRRVIYAGTCSVYGYTVNELCTEDAVPASTFPYGISKLQGEQALMQMKADGFSVICFRKGTVCGYSPRMRLDLVVNTMFKSAMLEKTITVNNPSIWRPILGIQDAASAYIRAIEANQEISGVFNIASGNYTVGEIGDIVKAAVEEHVGAEIKLFIKNALDYRSYKVSIERARNMLSFKPRQDVEGIVKDLIDHVHCFDDFLSPEYYNIQTFKTVVS